MNKKFFLKILLSYIITSSAMAALIMIFSFSSVRRHYIEIEAGKLADFSRALILWAGPELKSADVRALQKIMVESGKETRVRFTLIKADGTVAADSLEDPASMDNHATRPEVLAALKGGQGRATRFSNTLDEEMLYISVPVMDEKEKVVMVVRASMPLTGIKRLTNSLYMDILKAMALVLILSFAAAAAFTYSIYAPIKNLVMASKQVSSGNFKVRVSLRERNELKELADNFNEMTSDIDRLFTEVNEKKSQLDAIISSVAEGLLVVDTKGRIILMNKSFEKISGTDCREGNFYWECFMPVKFNETVEAGLKGGKNITEQIEAKSRIYLCGVTYMPARAQAAIVMYDITEFKDLERIKKDFVANVSHELRTPLTAIKGFTETLEERTKDGEELHYLDVIKKHTDRLINIVSDLLTLSQLEQAQAQAVREDIDLKQLVSNVLKIFEQQAKAKGLYVKLNIEEKLPAIKGDYFKLEQVLINLVDNAVKYTEKGGITVGVSSGGSAVNVVVEDTGIGIPQEHTARIFERFYVVDKSRSKKLGGTGLGLSIVKHIVALHKGTIEVDSTPGQGTKLTVKLPI